MAAFIRYLRANPILVVTLGLAVAFGLMSEQFMTAANLQNVLRQVSMLGFVALGMALVILVGGIDLSVGAVVALTTVLVAGIAAEAPPIVGIHVALLAGAAIGFANGALIAGFRFQPIVVTLSTMAIVRGLAMAWSDSRPIFGTLPDVYFLLANGTVAGVPVPAALFLATAALLALFLARTTTGRQIYQVGGNEEAARLAGIDVAGVKVLVYTLSGLLSAVAGLILTARMQSGEAVRTGVGWELDAIAAAAIGGLSLAGGVGTVTGAVCGALIIAMMANAFNLLGINPYWQRIVVGLVLAAAVAAYSGRFARRPRAA